MVTLDRCSLLRGASLIAAAAPRSRTENCPLQPACINRVATAVPLYDVNDALRRFAQSLLNYDRGNSLRFQRMADKSGTEHRYSCLAPSNPQEGDRVDTKGLYARIFQISAARARLDLSLESTAEILSSENATDERLSFGRFTHTFRRHGRS
jgi:hypothetical protein